MLCKAQELKREWGTGGPTCWALKTSAAPATVSGERAFIRPLFLVGDGKAKVRRDPQARRPALHR